MGIDLPITLRKAFETENDVRVREVLRDIEAIARNAVPSGGAPGSPGTVPLIPAAKDLNLVTVTATSHAMGIEDVILVDDDTAGGDVTINLIAIASTFKYPRWIKKLGTTGKIILDPNGSETIDGLTTIDILIPKATVAIISDGSNWQII